MEIMWLTIALRNHSQSKQNLNPPTVLETVHDLKSPQLSANDKNDGCADMFSVL